MTNVLAIRLSDLAHHVEKNQRLIREYEEEYDDARDPRDRSRYLRQIAQLKASAEFYRAEYESLKIQLTPVSADVSTAATLKQIKDTLDEIKGSLEDLKTTVVKQYDSSLQTFVQSIIQQLAIEDVQGTEIVLEKLNAGQIEPDEKVRLVREVEAVMSELKIVNAKADTLLATNIAGASKIMQSPILEFNNKLKLSIPIIPLLLHYEAELSLKTGVNLRNLWNRLSHNKSF